MARRKKNTEPYSGKYREIIQLRNSGLTYKEIRQRLKVSYNVISEALKQAKTEDLLDESIRKRNNSSEKNEKYSKILELWNSEMTQQDIATELKISKSTVGRALREVSKERKDKRNRKKNSEREKTQQERYAKILEMVSAGMTQQEIGELLQISQPYVSIILKKGSTKSGPSKNRKQLKEERYAKIIELYNSGESMEDIAQKLAIAISTVQRALRDEKRKNGFIKKNKRHNKKAEARYAKIVELWNLGIEKGEIKNQLQISMNTINNALKKAKANGQHVEASYVQKRNEKVIKLWNSGKSHKDIIKETGISQGTLSKILSDARKSGIAVREYKGPKRKKRKETLKQSQSKEESQSKEKKNSNATTTDGINIAKPTIQPTSKDGKNDPNQNPSTDANTKPNSDTQQSKQLNKEGLTKRIYRDISIDAALATKIRQKLEVMLPQDAAKSIGVKPYIVYDFFDSLSDAEQKELKQKFLKSKIQIYRFVRAKRKEGIHAAQALKNLEYKTTMTSYKDLAEVYLVLGDLKASIRVINQMIQREDTNVFMKKELLSQRERVQNEISSQGIRRDFYINKNMDGTKISWDDLCKKYKVRTTFLMQVIGMQRDVPNL